MNRSIQSLARALVRLTESAAAVLVFALVVVNLLQVVFRYVVASPLGWTEEFMRYAVVWVVFLASGAVLYRGEHMTIDILADFIPASWRRAQYILILVCVGAFCFILVWFGWPLAIRNATQVSPSARIPMIIPYSAVVVGGLLTLFKAFALALLPPGTPPMGKEGGGSDR